MLRSSLLLLVYILVVTMLLMGHHTKAAAFGPYDEVTCIEYRDQLNEFAKDNDLPLRASCRIQA